MLLVVASIGTYGQSGGTFEITESVIAAGGSSMSGGIFEVESTSGQAAAGGPIGQAPFSVTAGFWNFEAFAPTAAEVSISGRVLSPDGAGVTNAILYLQMPDGQMFTSRSATFGYYRFDGIVAGQTVLVFVKSKRFNYAPRVVTPVKEITSLDFTPEP